jgi:Putative papain-like cysteine peptidase (DUF1796)
MNLIMDFYFGKKGCMPISLGFGCAPAEFIAFCGKRDGVFYERQVFDWLGTNMWAITELTENGFSDFLSPEYFARRARFTYREDSWPTNIKYDIVFIHDFKHTDYMKEFKEFKERYKRRVERYLSLLRSNKELLLLRVESDGTEVVHCPESHGNWADELTPLRNFALYLKKKGAKYSIIYLTYSGTTRWDPELRVCFVNFPKFSYRERFSAPMLEKILNDNLEFIKTSIN